MRETLTRAYTRRLAALEWERPIGGLPLSVALDLYLGTLPNSTARHAQGRAVREFLVAAGPLSTDELTGATLAGYRTTLVALAHDGAAPSAPGEVNARLAALRAFLGFLAETGAVGLPGDLIHRTLADLAPPISRNRTSRAPWRAPPAARCPPGRTSCSRPRPGRPRRAGCTRRRRPRGRSTASSSRSARPTWRSCGR